jgi:hypothetical protein
MPQFGASLTDDSRIVIYDRNMFIVQATGVSGRIQIPGLRIMFPVFYRRETREQPVRQYFENNPAYSIVQQ